MKVGALARRAYLICEEVSQTLAQAQDKLLAALGLRNFSPFQPLTYMRSSAAVMAAGRFDAEFAAPRIQELLEHLGHGGSTLNGIARIRKEKFRAKPLGTFDVCSSGFVVLAPVGALPELLMAYLRLPQIAELLHLYATASMYPSISETDLVGLPIPMLNKQTDLQVQALVNTAKSRPFLSENLLAAATRAVEIAIGEGDTAALAFVAEEGANDAAAG